MCGIVGFSSTPSSMAADAATHLARKMCDRLAHRGPDAADVWVDAASGIALGHRRLSIIDLSPAGAQPMRSADRRWVITFNGEIYNFPELRRDLEARSVRFRGHSDTEILIEAVSVWGLDGTLARVNGMFAFALWDATDRVLHLARDRIGEKPLYFGAIGDGWVFASELKAIREHPGLRREIDRGALAAYFRHGYVPSPWSIYRGVQKLRPGTIVTLVPGEPPRERTYWSAGGVYERAAAAPFAGTPAEAVEQVAMLLRDSVRIRMHADVPLGAFLSGGIDSSVVVSLMQAQSSRPVQTFTIGFREERFDEARAAREVARHLGTEHTELYVTGEDSLALVPRMAEICDEPFGDSSVIPTFLVAQLARRHVTVSLSGDGGDELFGGYSRYAIAQAAWRLASRAPPAVRLGVSKLLRAIPAGPWDRALAATQALLPVQVTGMGTAARRQQVADLLGSRTRQELYRTLLSAWRAPETVVLGAAEHESVLLGSTPRMKTFLEEMSYLDLVTYLPDDILVKVDRASMAVSLEARVPMLDHRLVELAASLAADLKVRDGKHKWPLRQVLYRSVPRALIERPKQGFAVPLGAWLRGPLRSWAQDLLSADRLRREGYLDPRPVVGLLERHIAGQEDGSAALWNALSFEAWIAAERPGASP
jgi:asparagine synthase (glutamine-hydrolysing)